MANYIGANARMILGIVGASASAWTTEGEAEARDLIRVCLSAPLVSKLVSGGCHRGGVDKWAAEIGRELGLPVTEFLPKVYSWTQGFRPRNIQIAERSDFVHSITVAQMPEGSQVRGEACFHCGVTDHQRSGGCWTVRYARTISKPAHVHVIAQKDIVAALAKKEAARMVGLLPGDPAPYLNGCFNRLFRRGSLIGYDAPMNRERFLHVAMAEAQRIITTEAPI